MKYPFTPDYLDALPNNLVRLQNKLNDDIIADICRRMRLSGELTESAIHQIMMLQRQGLNLKDIEKRIAATSKQSRKEIDELFDRAVKRNQEYYDYTISKANIVPPVDAAQRLATQAEAIRRQTMDEFNNITRSMGFAVNVGGKTQFLPIAKAYQQVLDNALMKVSSGAFDYNTAIKGAVDELANSGLQWVDYASGHRNRIEVAARRAVIYKATAPSISPHYIDSLFRKSMNESVKKYLKAQKWLDNKVLEDTKPFLPSVLFGFKTPCFDVDRAIFSPPAIIVYWSDGTKTVVKCDPDDIYSKEAGVALCFMKKALGNKGNYNQVLKRLTGQD